MSRDLFFVERDTSEISVNPGFEYDRFERVVQGYSRDA